LRYHGEQRAEACGEIIDEIADMNDRASDDDGCTSSSNLHYRFSLTR
jgi:hypothetical protein